MDHRQIVIANLAKGTIGEQATNVLGSLLVSHIQLTAMARSAMPPEQRVPHFIHVDEFQSFTTDAFASIFSEARKFAAYFCLANQYTKQIPEIVRAAVLGNAGSFISLLRCRRRRRIARARLWRAAISTHGAAVI
jgi:hypothetical protein